MMRKSYVAMLLAVVLALPAVAVAAAGVADPPSPTTVVMTPRFGGRRTEFRVSFRNPDPTGRLGSLQRLDVLSASGPTGRGCVSKVSMTLRPAPARARVRATVDAVRLGGTWCVGRFHGELTEIQSILCLPTRICPQFVVAPRVLARFSFRVKPAPTTTRSHRSRPCRY